MGNTIEKTLSTSDLEKLRQAGILQAEEGCYLGRRCCSGRKRGG